MKLVDLSKTRAKKEVNPDVVITLEHLLRQAKNGEISGILTFVSNGEDKVGHVLIPPKTIQESMMIMAIMDVVKLELADMLYATIQFEEVGKDDNEDQD